MGGKRERRFGKFCITIGNFSELFERRIVKIQRKQKTDFSSISQLLPFCSAPGHAED
jgi:hypothetical protein